MIAPCRPTCPAGDCANCAGFDRQPQAEQPRCVPRTQDLYAATDDMAEWGRTHHADDELTTENRISQP